jgi:hypothetical protein
LKILNHRIVLLLPLLAMTPAPVGATSEYNKAISHVGAQGTNGYVIFAAPPTAGCNWGNVYLNITTDSGRAYYALLLSAYASNRPISRIDYTRAADGTCTVDLVEM